MADEHLDPYHLPRSVMPSRYDLTLQPDLEAATVYRLGHHRP